MFAYKKGFWAIMGLILASGAVLAYMGSQPATATPNPPSAQTRTDGLVSIDAALAQTKVMVGSDGKVSMSLHMKGAELVPKDDQPPVPMDFVVVLDRSGSMNGEKIAYARDAIVSLLDRLSARDRLALVTYSDDVRTESGLLPVNGPNREILVNAVQRVRAGGGTNLGSGLHRGIDMIVRTSTVGRQRKVILISDGLANQGITDPQALGRMASAAVQQSFSVSTVGVGLDFNEMLMTSLADYGSGRYYFLENPQAFAQVFEDEFQTARQVVASGLELHIPLRNGLRLTHAGGFPISVRDNVAVFHPGDLLSGQERNLFLSFAVPSDRVGQVAIEGIQVRYQHQGVPKTLDADLGLKVACVADAAEVAGSFDEKTWSRQVLQEEYSRLKDSVADAVRKGEQEAAMERIQAYEARTRQLNATVGSAVVNQNLDEDVRQLREEVKETFAGEPAAVAAKRKQHSKALQYDSYQTRRDKKK